MNKLNTFGVGPVIAVSAIPWLALAIYISSVSADTFTYVDGGSRLLTYAGTILIVAGAAMYFLSVPLLLRGLKETRLITSGTFYLSRNPLYAALIALVIPGLSLVMNSWLVFTASILAYTVFKITIKKECAEMEKFFGKDYLDYKSRTPEFFPFPIRKWLS
jgi:protein-S-isoprenylcysteine O-methyltransferase Ste14